MLPQVLKDSWNVLSHRNGLRFILTVLKAGVNIVVQAILN